MWLCRWIDVARYAPAGKAHGAAAHGTGGGDRLVDRIGVQCCAVAPGAEGSHVERGRLRRSRRHRRGAQHDEGERSDRNAAQRHTWPPCAACYRFRSTHVVIDRRFCTTVVLIGSTSSAPRSFVTCINIASSTRYRSVPSAIAYQRSCRCRTRRSAPIVDASRQKKSPPGLSVRQQPCSIAWK